MSQHEEAPLIEEEDSTRIESDVLSHDPYPDSASITVGEDAWKKVQSGTPVKVYQLDGPDGKVNVLCHPGNPAVERRMKKIKNEEPFSKLLKPRQFDKVDYELYLVPRSIAVKTTMDKLASQVTTLVKENRITYEHVGMYLPKDRKDGQTLVPVYILFFVNKSREVKFHVINDTNMKKLLVNWFDLTLEKKKAMSAALAPYNKPIVMTDYYNPGISFKINMIKAARKRTTRGQHKPLAQSIEERRKLAAEDFLDDGEHSEIDEEEAEKEAEEFFKNMQPTEKKAAPKPRSPSGASDSGSVAKATPKSASKKTPAATPKSASKKTPAATPKSVSDKTPARRSSGGTKKQSTSATKSNSARGDVAKRTTGQKRSSSGASNRPTKRPAGSNPKRPVQKTADNVKKVKKAPAKEPATKRKKKRSSGTTGASPDSKRTRLPGAIGEAMEAAADVVRRNGIKGEVLGEKYVQAIKTVVSSETATKVFYLLPKMFPAVFGRRSDLLAPYDSAIVDGSMTREEVRKNRPLNAQLLEAGSAIFGMLRDHKLNLETATRMKLNQPFVEETRDEF